MVSTMVVLQEGNQSMKKIMGTQKNKFLEDIWKWKQFNIIKTLWVTTFDLSNPDEVVVSWVLQTVELLT